MTDLATANGVFNVLVEGDAAAPVLMLSNSLGTNLHMWDRQMPDLLRAFRVVRYDARGHGKSVVTDGPYSLEGLSQDALAIMDALGLPKVDWMGLSMGGMVGQWLLTHAPARIGRAVLANTAASMAAPDIWNSRIETVLSKGMEAITDSVVERWFTKGFTEAHPEAIEPIVHMLHTTPPAGYAGCCAAIRDMDQREAIRAVKAPVLVIVGRHDPSTPPGLGALIASAIEGAKLVTLEAAHLSNIEDAEAYTETVVAFLTAPPAATKPAVAPAAPPAPRRVSVRRRPAKVPPAKAPVRATPPQPAATSTPQKQVAAKKPARKTARKAAAKKSTARRAIAKAAHRKTTAKTAAKKATAKKSPARAIKKAAPKKSMGKKTAAKKTSVKKTLAKKSAAKKTVAKTRVVKKSTARRTPGRKGRR